MPSSTKPAWLQADRRKTKVISSGCTPPSHILSVEEFPYHGHAWHILQVWHSKRPHHVITSCWTVSKHLPCSHILHTCQPSYLPQKYLNPIHFDWSPHEPTCPLSVQLCWHMHSALPKVTESSCTPSCCIHGNSSSALWPCPHFTCPNIMVFQVTISCDGILLDTLPASSVHPHFAYMSTKLVPTKRSESHPLQMICSWAHLPSSNAPMLAHAFSTHVKVTESGCTIFIVLFYFIKIIINRETFAVFTITLTSFSLAFYKTCILKWS